MKLVKVNLYIMLPEDLLIAIRAYAARSEMSKSEAIRRLLYTALGREPGVVRRGRPPKGFVFRD